VLTKAREDSRGDIFSSYGETIISQPAEPAPPPPPALMIPPPPWSSSYVPELDPDNEPAQSERELEPESEEADA